MNTMRFGVLVALAMFLLGCGKDYGTEPTPPSGPAVTIFSATGDITAKVNEFRNALGASNGGTPGEQPGGRREISWDGAAADPFNNRNDFPADFFNSNAKNGAVFTTAGTGFRNDSTLFKEVNPDYGAEFNFFSPTKIFAAVGSNQMDQLFQVAGQPTPATSRGFGAVFSDVDVADRTTIECFTEEGFSLGRFAAPVRSNGQGLSFVGVTFPDAIIARVRITMGTGALGVGINDISAGGTLDLVVVDNLIYGEPKAAF
jgi:hypothetical protein